MVLSILVTDGLERTALAVVRSLGRAGHRVFVCSPLARSLAGASRYSVREARVAEPLAAPEAFVADVERLVRRWDINALVPISEEALLALLPQRARFTGVRIPFASDEKFRCICDKQAVLEAATSLGIATPSQLSIRSPDDRAGLDSYGLRFPLVVKSARSVSEGRGFRVKSGATHVPDQTALGPVLAAYPPHCYPLLLQQWIGGPGIGVSFLFWNGEVLATFAHRRIREKPPGGGVSVYSESIRPDPGLVLRSRRLLERFGWEGVAMVEYKLDEASETPYLMEINGRFWGSLQLSIDAGVDFPALLVAAALGEQPVALTDYKVGIRSRWWWGEVDHLLLRLRRSKRALGLPQHAPGRFRALLEFLTPWHPGDRNEVLRFDDPMPFFRETRAWVQGI